MFQIVGLLVILGVFFMVLNYTNLTCGKAIIKESLKMREVRSDVPVIKTGTAKPVLEIIEEGDDVVYMFNADDEFHNTTGTSMEKQVRLL